LDLALGSVIDAQTDGKSFESVLVAHSGCG
jgi:hypothetical protein